MTHGLVGWITRPIKGENTEDFYCVQGNFTWKFWDKEWKKGDIKVSCDQDLGIKEQGRSSSISFQIHT